MSLPVKLDSDIVSKLTNVGKTLVTAESCSGGLIAHRLTNVPGASTPFLGGIVAYTNAVKMALLAVPASTLETFGAVSEETARAMAEGARAAMAADMAIAVTGNAGPHGEPLGLVHVALAREDGTRAEHHVFEGDRESIKMQTAEAALNLVWESLNT